MSDKFNFHEIALKSVLFKGRPDLYFCYLKSEKIAHSIARIFPRDEFSESISERLLRASSYLPDSIVRYAAHELEEEGLLVDLFELLSLVRLSVSHASLEEQNGRILVEEYEGIVEKIMLGRQASPFLSLADFEISPFPQSRELPQRSQGQKDIKDKKTDAKSQLGPEKSKGHNGRSLEILKILNQKKRCSIKDISKEVRNCSEKTIQRELNGLIRQGLVKKEGERRWSTYSPLNSTENAL